MKRPTLKMYRKYLLFGPGWQRYSLPHSALVLQGSKPSTYENLNLKNVYHIKTFKNKTMLSLTVSLGGLYIVYLKT